jgi:hypothetical protein
MEALGYLPEPIITEADASSAAELTQPMILTMPKTLIRNLAFM